MKTKHKLILSVACVLISFVGGYFTARAFLRKTPPEIIYVDRTVDLTKDKDVTVKNPEVRIKAQVFPTKVTRKHTIKAPDGTITTEETTVDKGGSVTDTHAKADEIKTVEKIVYKDREVVKRVPVFVPNDFQHWEAAALAGINQDKGYMLGAELKYHFRKIPASIGLWGIGSPDDSTKAAGVSVGARF
jgi:hypothetical protein